MSRNTFKSAKLNWDVELRIMEKNYTLLKARSAVNLNGFTGKPEKTADIFAMPMVSGRKRAQKFHTDEASLSRSGQCF